MSLNIVETSKKLNIPQATLRNWENKLSLNFQRNSHNNRVFLEEDVDLLKSIKDLRDDGNGFETIQKKLNLNSNLQEDKNNLQITSQEQKSYQDNSETVQILNNKIDSLEVKLDSIIQLSEKYSRATYEIGKLKAQLEAKDEKMKMISDSSSNELIKLQSQISLIKEEKEKELESMRLENELLREELEKERNKSSLEKFKSTFFNKKAKL